MGPSVPGPSTCAREGSRLMSHPPHARLGRRAFVAGAAVSAALVAGPLPRIGSASASTVEQQPLTTVAAQPGGVSEEEGIIVIRQPAPYDIVDNPIQVAGIATAFEG